MPPSLFLIHLFAIIGVFDTGYLAYHKIRGTDPACPLLPPEWCRTVQNSPQSTTFGISNSVAGLIAYGAILVLASMFFANLIPLWPLQAIIAIGFLFSLYFYYVQAFVLRAFCPWCLLSAINFIALTAAAFLF